MFLKYLRKNIHYLNFINFIKKESIAHPIVALALAYVIWGVSQPITKLALGEIRPFDLLFLRLIIGCGIIFPFAVYHQKHKFTLHEQLYIFVSGFFGVFLNIVFFYLGIAQISAMQSSLIMAFEPFTLILLTRILLKDRISMQKLLGIFVCFVGIVLGTVLPEMYANPNDLKLGTSVVGILLILLAGLCGALGTIFLRPLRHIDGHVVSFWQFAISAFLVFPLVVSHNPVAVVANLGYLGWIGVIYAGLLSGVAAYSLHHESLHKLKNVECSLLSNLMPVCGILFSIPILGEFPSFWFIIGTALVVVGVVLGEAKFKKHKYAK